jgi:DNA-binding response OmpR family regulator
MFTQKSMEVVRQHPPVILLLGPCETDKIDQWLEHSPYSTSQVTDPFQALEQISDFTIRSRPDVIFLHVDSLADEMVLMQSIVANDKSEIPIIGFGSRDQSEEATIDALAARLDQLIPHHSLM